MDRRRLVLSVLLLAAFVLASLGTLHRLRLRNETRRARSTPKLRERTPTPGAVRAPVSASAPPTAGAAPPPPPPAPVPPASGDKATSTLLSTMMPPLDTFPFDEIHARQHPKDCSTARILVARWTATVPDRRGGGVGMGRMLRDMAGIMAFAHKMERTLVVKDGPAMHLGDYTMGFGACEKEGSKGYECLLQPFSSCTAADAKDPTTGNYGEVLPDTSASELLGGPRVIQAWWDNIYAFLGKNTILLQRASTANTFSSSKFTPLVTDKALARGYDVGTWYGVYMRYVLRPSKLQREYIVDMVGHLGMPPDARLVTMQIRRGDRYKEVQVADKAKGYSKFRQHDFVRTIQALETKMSAKFNAAYVATDNAETLAYMRANLSHITVYAQEASRVYFAQAALSNIQQKERPQMGLEVIADIHMLASGAASAFVGNCFSGMSTVPAAMIIGDNKALTRGDSVHRPVAVDGGCGTYGYWPVFKWTNIEELGLKHEKVAFARRLLRALFSGVEYAIGTMLR